MNADEVWLTAEVSDVGGPSLFRHRGEGWEQVGPANGGTESCYDDHQDERTGWSLAVVATDGAIWAGMADGLTRFSADTTVVGPGIQACLEFPGLDGGVWARISRAPAGFELHRADGTTQSVPLPRGTEMWPVGTAVCGWAAGPDGSVIVSPEAEAPSDDGDEESCDLVASTLLRWDGQSWGEIEPPASQLPVVAQMVTDDGAAWVMSYGYGVPDPGSLIRYADGRWTTISTDTAFPLVFRAAPAGRVCALEQSSDENSDDAYGSGIACFDRTGEIAHFDLPAMKVTDFSIAPDGAIWVLGDQVVRIAEPVEGTRVVHEADNGGGTGE